MDIERIELARIPDMAPVYGGAQDGPSEKSEVTSISTEGDGWYTVFFNDMGIKSSCRFQAKIVEGKVYICDFENGSIE